MERPRAMIRKILTLSALCLAGSFHGGRALAQYTPDICNTGNVNCAGNMCTYMRSMVYRAVLSYSNNANCSPTMVAPLGAPLTFEGTGTGASPRCVWLVQTNNYQFVGFCDMTGEEGLPVELMGFSVGADEEDAGPADGAPTATRSED